MSNVALYINNQRCDMFEGETINLTKRIVDLSDASKVLSNFTKSFNIPASATNNAILGYYFNPDVSGNFDPNAKIPAYLEANGIMIDEGVVEFQNVNTKRHRPEQYSVVFYGAVATLKDVFKSDTLEEIDISGLDHVVDYSGIVDSWSLNLEDGNVVYPLVNYERPWIYSSDLANVNDSRNIRDSDYGILASELKPAVRLKYIWDAIFDKYGLTYDSTIIDSSGTFNQCYMLMHREAGDLNNVESVNDNYTEVLEGGTIISGSGAFQIDFTSKVQDTNSNFDLATDAYTAPLSGNYTFRFSRTNISYVGAIPEIGYKINAGTLTGFDSNFTGNGVSSFSVFLNAGDEITLFVTISTSISIISGRFYTWYYPRYAYGDTVNMNDQWPKGYKVIDFMNSVIKMFNLILVPNSSTDFTVENKESYFLTGDVKDWTKYIDIESIKIEKPELFKDVSFEYSEPKDAVQIALNDALDRKYASASYVDDNGFADGSLNIKPDFTPFFPVEMLDQDASGVVLGNTGIYIQRMLGDDDKPIVDSKPRIFYYDDDLLINCQGFYLQDGEDGSGNPTFNFEPQSPFASMFTNLIADADTESLNFSIEEPFNGLAPTKTLFQEYYSNYVRRQYDFSNRIVTVKARLPLAEFYEFAYNDNIYFDGHYYIIQDLKYNLNTQESTIVMSTYVRDKQYSSADSSRDGKIDIIGGELSTTINTPLLYNVTQDNYWRTFTMSRVQVTMGRGRPTGVPRTVFNNGFNVEIPE